ncbi:MAG TPA: helix-turn-helix domain-containing protein [Firmicutes bacterium]|nr:helix-turn-helix domain-containing protein [Bacillota bacterium]
MSAETVGRQIFRLRKAKGITQNELGERLGISFQAISKWERGGSLR